MALGDLSLVYTPSMILLGFFFLILSLLYIYIPDHVAPVDTLVQPVAMPAQTLQTFCIMLQEAYSGMPPDEREYVDNNVKSIAMDFAENLEERARSSVDG